jgi:hypothetical protein
MSQEKKNTRRGGKKGKHKNRKQNNTNNNKGNKKSIKHEELLMKRKMSEQIDYTMDGSVKQLFLNLTRMQIPFDYEKTLESYFPEGMEKDDHGNYFKIIGDTDIMFCAHLDTYCYLYDKVYHIIEGDIIKTDGTSTLGGDDKAGVVIMIKMMEAGIPGLYYFFRGEEGVTSPSGTWGSRQAIKTRKEFFKDYNKCIAFDRKGNTSIISQQMYSECCSEDFVDSLITEFKNNGLTYRDDDTGMWCDSGVFMELIPECTNISVGYKSEHTYNEEQDIAHLDDLVKACLNINWEGLPTKRDPSVSTYGVGNYRYSNNYDWDWNSYKDKYGKTTYEPFTHKGEREYSDMEEMFLHVCDILDKLNYECLNPESFEEAEEMYFQNMANNEFFAMRIIDYEIYMTEDEKLIKYTNLGDLDTFEKYVMSGYNDVDTPTQQTPNTGKNYPIIAIDAYVSIINKYPDMVIDIMEDMIKYNNKSAINSVSVDLWTDIEKKFKALGYTIDYSDSGTGINPDDFTDWIGANWDDIDNRLSNYRKKNSGFLGGVKKISLYTDKQHEIFSEIIDNSELLTKLVLKDLDINNRPDVRSTTYQKVRDELKTLGHGNIMKKGLRNINEDEFVNWVYDYYKNIEKYINER